MSDGTPHGVGSEIQQSQVISEEVSSTEPKPISRTRQFLDKLKTPLKRLWNYPGEKTTLDQRVMVGDQPMHFSAQEFKPKEGEIKAPEEVVLFLVGAPMRAAASVTWAHPEDLANKFKAKTYEVDARPVGAYKGNAVDLEVEAIRDFIKTNKFKKVTIIAHSIGVPKAFELAAILEQNEPGIKVNGIVANNPVGLYEQDKLDILKRYKTDGDNQGLEVNRNPRPRPDGSSGPRHASLPKVIAQLVGSMVKDFWDTGMGYKKFLEDQLDVATKVSPYLAQVKAPILFLLSSEDQVGQVDKIFPPELLQSAHDRSQIATRGRARDQHMKDHYAKNSERVMVVESTKFPTHIATTVERSENSAHIASRIFDWFARNPQQGQQKAA